MKRIVLIIIMLLNINKSSAQSALEVGLFMLHLIPSPKYGKNYEKSKYRIELTKTFNNYRFYGNLIDSTSIDLTIANKLGVGIEVDAYFLLENNKKHIPKLSRMAVDSSQNLVFIYSEYIKKIAIIDEENRSLNRQILYEKDLSKDIIASKNENLYINRESEKKER